MFEKLGDRWEDKFEDLPGFSLVVAIVALVLAAWSPQGGGEATPHETNPLVAVAVAYLLYRSGSLLDKVFDSLYGTLEEPGPRFYGGKALDAARLEATRNLKCPVPGLYNKAASLLRNSEEWKNEVKGKMDGSKAARSLKGCCRQEFTVSGVKLLNFGLGSDAIVLACQSWGNIKQHFHPSAVLKHVNSCTC